MVVKKWGEIHGRIKESPRLVGKWVKKTPCTVKMYDSE